MPLRYERRHLPYRTWYHKRLPGRGRSGPDEEFCLLLDSDPGTEVEEVLLDTSTTGVDEYCIELDTSS